jgi:hypothetical protein
MVCSSGVDLHSNVALRGATWEGEVEREGEEAHRGGEKTLVGDNCMLLLLRGGLHMREGGTLTLPPRKLEGGGQGEG